MEHWEQDYVMSLLGEAEVAADNERLNLVISLLANALAVSIRDHDPSLADQAKRIAVRFVRIAA